MSVAQKYYAYRSFSTMAFVGVVWLLFYRLFMSDYRVGILDMISFAIGMLAEIPSGTLGDKYGHKKIAVIGCTLAGLGLIMQGAANAYWMVLVSQIIMTCGWALRSGSDTALVYEAYKAENGSSKNWKKVLNRAGQFTVAVELLAYFSGGYMYVWYKPLPFIAMGIGSIISGFFLLSIKDYIAASDNVQNEKSYLQRMKDGLKQVSGPRLRRFVPIVLIVSGLFYAFSFGLLRPVLQDRYGFGAIEASWLLLGCGIFTLLLQALAHRSLERIKESQVIIGSSILLIIGLAISSRSTVGAVGVVIIAMLYSFEYIINPWIDDAVNSIVEKEHRATALSAIAFLKSVPYVVFAPVIGILSSNGSIGQFLLFYAVAILSAASLYLLFSRRMRTV